MLTRLTQQAIALGLAALVTLGVLAGLDGLADSEHADARAQLVQAAAAQPA
jgi:hypothetical protein